MLISFFSENSSSLNQQHNTTVPVLQPAVFTMDVSLRISPEVGRKGSESGTSVCKPMETQHPEPSSNVTHSEPMSDLLTCISPAATPSDLAVGADSGVRDTINSSSADDSQGASTQLTEQITRAKDGLISASRHAVPPQPVPCVADTNSETDSVWNRISLHVNALQQLKIRDLDFSDLLSDDDSLNTNPPASSSVPVGTVPTPVSYTHLTLPTIYSV